MANTSTFEMYFELDRSMTKNCDGAEYLPQLDLFDILTTTKIESVLRESESKSHQIADTVKQIFQGARKTFAILILSNCAGRIREFIQSSNPHGFPVDGKLPYEHNEDLESFGLTKVERQSFFRNQWKVIAPVLDFDCVLPMSLHEDILLPFQPMDGKDTLLAKGGFGEVHNIVIEPRHQKVPFEVSHRRSWTIRKAANKFRL